MVPVATAMTEQANCRGDEGGRPWKGQQVTSWSLFSSFHRIVLETLFLNFTVACQFLASHYPLKYHNELISNFQFWLPLLILYKPIAVWWQQCNHKKKRNIFHMLEDPPVHQQERSCLSSRPRLEQSSRRSRTQVSVSEARGLDRQELDRNMIGGEVAYPSQGLWAGDKCSGEEEETRKKWNQGVSSPFLLRELYLYITV